MYTAIIIGSGFSGICMGIQLLKRGVDNFVILEKAIDLGGTWRENTYPGAECDIPSALYSYSFESNPGWDYKWSRQDQILRYLKHCAAKYGLIDKIVYEKEVVSASFNEDQNTWKTLVKDGSLYTSRILISAIGQLHHPRLPNLPGMDSFTGKSWHSARWNHEIDLTGKKVGVIGNAASAVQLIPELSRKVNSLYVFQRSANWMLPKPDRAYNNWEKKLRARIPFLLRLERLRLWLTGGVLFFLMGQNRFFKKIAQRRSIAFIRKEIVDPDLQVQLIPDYPIGAKRILFSDNYYASLNRANVNLITSTIHEVTSDGIKVIGENLIHLDAIIYATGFYSNPFLKGIDIIGNNGQKLRDFWKKEEKAYLGMTVTGFPNFFIMYGPNTNLGHNSIVIMSECQAGYIAQCLEKMEKNKWQYLEVKMHVLESFYEKIQQRLKHSAWAQVKDSWYKSGEAIPNNWPGRTWEYIRKTRAVNFSSYHIH